MPAINETIKVGDKLTVFNYQSGKAGWYLRQWNKAERKYRIKKIEGATTKEEALANFYKAVVSFTETDQRVNTKHVNVNSASYSLTVEGLTLIELIDDFLHNESERVSAGLKASNAHSRRKTSLKTFKEYLRVKEITYPSQITPLLLEDYPVFRGSMMKHTRKTELKDISVFLTTYLVQRELLTNEIARGRNFIPKVAIKEEDLDANPAITPKDYRTINSFFQVWVKQAPTHRGSYMRQHMYSMVHILKNSGLRPNELLSLRRKDIKITKQERWSESKDRYVEHLKLLIHVRKSKTGKRRDVPCVSDAGEHMVKWLKFQSAWMSHDYPRFCSSETDLIFGKPQEMFDKGFHYHYLNCVWREQVYLVLRPKLGMNRFSERDYTLYSLRSTFIEDCIAEGLDVYLVARLCGNSVEIIQRYYDRSDILKRSDEIQYINLGRRKPIEPEEIDVLDL